MRNHAGLWLAASIVVAGAWLLHGQPGTSREEAHRQNNRGVAHLERYDYDAAAAAFRQALKIDPGLTAARLNLAIALLYDGELDAATVEARAAIAGLPQSPNAHYVAGLVSRAANRPAEALTAFQRVLELDPDDAGSRTQLGQIRLGERRYTEAAALFEAAAAREPFNATAVYGLATALVRGGQRAPGEAAMARFQALRDHPAAVTYSANYLEQGRYGEAAASTGLEPELIDPALPGIVFADATAALFGEDDPRGRAALFDADSDGDLDALFASSTGVTLLTNEGGRFARRRPIDTDLRDASASIAGDYDNDGRADLLVIGGSATRLYHQRADGAFTRQPIDAGDAGPEAPTRTAAFVDIDHDGDLDIFLSPPTRMLRNNGNGTFSDVSSNAGLAGTTGLTAVIPTDFDNRRDIDLLFVPITGVPALLSNARDGTFRKVAALAGLPDDAPYTAAATGDLNKDGAPDFVFARSGARAMFAMSASHGTFSLTAAPEGSADATAVQLFDYDNDGVLDLLAFAPGGPRLWRGLGSSWSDVTSSSLPAGLTASGDVPSAMSVGDVDTDGDYDVVARYQSGRIRFWRNSKAGAGTQSNSAVRVRLNARVSNRSGVGAKVEMLAGSLRQRMEFAAAAPPVAPADIIFGIGRRASADVVRVLWPSGILQAEPNPGRTVIVQELDRKPSSCPFLFSWNGSQFEFISDFMGGGEMGYWVAPGVRNVPDPEEYVRIRGDQLVPRNGRYDLRVTNELEEAVFFDRLQLTAVDHLRSADVYPNEGLRSPAAQRPFAIYTTRLPRPPDAAVDHHGHDVLERLREIDRRYFDDFAVDPIQGYAEEHSLTLNLGLVPAGSPLRLLLTGWTDYAFSSDNVAAHQRGVAFHPPSLQRREGDGTWRTILPELGMPVGRPQTVVADLTPHVPRAGGPMEVRVSTNLRVYWDQILVDTSEPAPYSITVVDPLEAELRWRGFSGEVSPEGRAPLTYDYDRVSTVSPWKTLPGRYTRLGDVRPLLTATDDRFVVAAPGDEITLSFDASRLPPLRDGWSRTFLLFADGFSKEMNLHSSSPDRLEPLPFHAMRSYPYRPPEHYPRTPAHDRYRAEYNTRVVGGPLPPLDPDPRAARK